MLLPHKDVSSIVTFTLAVDPGDTDDQDCEDLAVVQIDLKQCKLINSYGHRGVVCDICHKY